MQKGADPLDAARARLEREYLSALESSLSDQRAKRVIFDALTCSISLSGPGPRLFALQGQCPVVRVTITIDAHKARKKQVKKRLLAKTVVSI